MTTAGDASVERFSRLQYSLRMRPILSFFFAVLLASAPCGRLACQLPVPRASLNGEWTGTLLLDNSQPRVALVFALSDSTFTGKVYSDATFMGDMEDGSLVGSRVHFKVGRLEFTGDITGSRMKVDLIVYNGSTRTFTLVKTPTTSPGTGSDSSARRNPRKNPDKRVEISLSSPHSGART